MSFEEATGGAPISADALRAAIFGKPYVQQPAPKLSADTCAHVWHEDSDDEGRTFKRCVRKGGCGRQFITGTAATRW